MIETLKPVIDANFRTLPARQYTVVMGSVARRTYRRPISHSNMAMSLAKRVFSRPRIGLPTACLSWHKPTPFGKTVASFCSEAPMKALRMVPDMQTMRTTLIDRGYPESEIRLEAHAYGAHNENYWSGEYTEVFKWLFADFNSAIATPESNLRLFIGPNPSEGTFTCYVQLQQAGMLRVFDLNGRMVHEMNIRPTGLKPTPEIINLHHLPAATYRVVLTDGANTASQTLVIH